jgi:hypothetical protein
VNNFYRRHIDLTCICADAYHDNEKVDVFSTCKQFLNNSRISVGGGGGLQLHHLLTVSNICGGGRIAAAPLIDSVQYLWGRKD